MKLSIIVPLYNSAQWLPKCIESLEHQDINREEYELILVDDGSPDNSKEIAESYASVYANIVVLSQTNKGTSGARNTGLRHASGTFVCFVDPDDYVKENSLGTLVHQMEADNLDVLRFNYVMVDEQYNVLPKPKSELAFDYSSKLMSGSSFIADRLGIACYVWAYMYRLSLIKDNGIWCLEGDYFDDTPWLPRVLSLAERVNVVDVEHYFYYQRSDSLVKSVSQKSIDAKINGHFILLENLKAQRSECHDPGVVKWYDRMIAHSSISLLSLIGVYRYDNRRALINKYYSFRLRPIAIIKTGKNVALKSLLINISPKLFCCILNRKETR